MWRWQGAQELVGWGLWKRGHVEIASRGEGVWRQLGEGCEGRGVFFWSMISQPAVSNQVNKNCLDKDFASYHSGQVVLHASWTYDWGQTGPWALCSVCMPASVYHLCSICLSWAARKVNPRSFCKTTQETISNKPYLSRLPRTLLLKEALAVFLS